MDVRIRPLTKQETLSRSSEWFLSGGEGGHSPQCPPDHISHTGRSSKCLDNTCSPQESTDAHTWNIPYSNECNQHSTALCPQPSNT